RPMAGYELGILGAGNMAEAIARGVIRAGLLGPQRIIAADVSAPRRELFTKQLGISTVEDNRQVVASQSAMLLLSVKPQHMAQVLDGIANAVSADTLII